MKTIEERTKEYIDQNFHRIAEEMPIEKGMETIYIESAEEQRELDIKKACEYLEDTLFPTVKIEIDGDIKVVNRHEFIDMLKKVMEE